MNSFFLLWFLTGVSLIPSKGFAVSKQEIESIIEKASFQKKYGFSFDFERLQALSDRNTRAFQEKVESGVDRFYYEPFLSKSFLPGTGSINGIDRIVLINLERRPQKLQRSLLELVPYGIKPEVLIAVDGKKCSPEVGMALGVPYDSDMIHFMATRYLPNGKSVHGVIEPSDSTWLCHHFSRMQMGCYLSHLSILWDSYLKNHEVVWVLEDDIEVARDPSEIESAIRSLENLVGKDGWDILYTDLDHKNNQGEVITAAGYSLRPNLIVRNDVFNRTDVGDDFIRYGSRYGTHSYVISRSGLRKVISFAETFRIYSPIDIDLAAIPGINQFGMKNSIIETNSFIHD